MLTIQTSFQLSPLHLPTETAIDSLIFQFALQNKLGSAHCYQNPGCLA